MYKLLLIPFVDKGRQNQNNIILVGPTNCGKSFLFDLMEMIFNSKSLSTFPQLHMNELV